MYLKKKLFIIKSQKVQIIKQKMYKNNCGWLSQ